MGSAAVISPEGKKSEVVIEELAKGRKFAMQLQDLLVDDGGPKPEMSGVLVAEILRTFEQGLFLLGCPSGDQISDNLQAPSFSSDNGGVDISKRPKKRPGVNSSDRRGRYKWNSSQSHTIYSANIEDDQAWRKYGQKAILNAKFPRSYYRCTHKYDRCCNALKQVQGMEGGSGMYQITYIGSHTCNSDPIQPPHLIIPKGDNGYMAFPDRAREEVAAKSDLTDNFSLGSVQDHSSVPHLEEGYGDGWEVYGKDNAGQPDVELEDYFNLDDLIQLDESGF
ncbi:hypothetical protein SAY86_007731 [Trapa natans]|uniref:WRKY domain-containing protein n=1 Tax=Trapa natans TaxID=22666 RepID=A0AAN7LBF0_TRANT|nr:hypothetical protein SAY86_007731 [Trapa natans]